MKKIVVRIMAVMTAILIMVTFSSCSLSSDDNAYIDFLLNGWDGSYEEKEEEPKDRDAFERPSTGAISSDFWASHNTSYGFEHLADTDF